MSLTGAALNRFRSRVDNVLDDAFPCTLLIAGVSVSASGPGAKTTTDYITGGESTNFRFPFRIPLASLVTPLAVGDSLAWVVSPIRTIALEITEISERPHDARISITCKNRRG